MQASVQCTNALSYKALPPSNPSFSSSSSRKSFVKFLHDHSPLIVHESSTTSHSFSIIPAAKMKFSVVAVASLFASVAYSQTIASEVAQLPSCALTCLTTAITGAGCGVSDYACQCGSAKSSITSAATPCVVSKCAISDALSTL